MNMYILVLLYFSLRSFFILPNGFMQIFDLFFILNFFLYILKRKKISSEEIRCLTPFVLFIGIVCLVNIMWSIYDESFSYLKSIIFYFYNLFFVLVNLRLFLENGPLYRKYLDKAVLINLVINLVLLTLGLGRQWQGRSYLYFGDPNQMSYFYVSTILISNLLNLKNKNIISILSLLLIIMTSSRSGLLVISSYYILLIIKSRNSLIKKIQTKNLKKIIVTIFIFISFLTIYHQEINEQLAFTISRFGESGDDDTLFSRGWDRIYFYPKYVILGSGEGGYEDGQKFSKSVFHSTLETHSTWANIILSYGVLGSFLFLNIIYKFLKYRDWYLYFIPLFLNGLSKVDTRQTTFWFIIILMIYFSKNNNQKEKIQ